MEKYVHIGGHPRLLAELQNVVKSDLSILIPICILLIIVTLWLFFRSILGVILPLLTVSISTIWTTGLWV